MLGLRTSSYDLSVMSGKIGLAAADLHASMLVSPVETNQLRHEI